MSDKDEINFGVNSTEKTAHTVVSVLSSQSNVFADEGQDITLGFMKQHQLLDSSLVQSVDLKKVTAKIDKKLMVLMTMCYTCQFIDKVVLNYSRIMGMTLDLGLVGNQFSDLSTYFFVAFLIFEPIQGVFIQKISPTRVLAVNVIIWGILTMCCAAPTNFAGMLAVRVILGCSEAAISPCLVLITASWYTRGQAAFRMGIWYCGLGLGQIIGGLISFLFQLVSHNIGFDSWRIMFLVIGFCNLVIGIASYLTLPLNPVHCNFLTDDEKYALLAKLSESKVGVHSKKFVGAQVLESLTDVTLYLFFFLTATISFSSNTITVFSSTDILSFGFTSKEAALLNMPSGAVSIGSTLLSTYFIMRGFPRALSITILCLPAACGGALLSFLPKHNKGGLLVGIYMINTIVAPLAIIYAWIANCVSGHTKKICFNIVVMFGFAVGNIVGPQSYRANDAPYYLPAKISMLATQCAGILFAGLLFLVYYYRNKRRDSEQAGLAVDFEAEMLDSWKNLSDFENRSFRYSY